MRLDKFLAAAGLGSRSQVKALLRSGRITLDGISVKSDKMQIDEKTASVKFDGKLVSYQKYYYYLLNKPAGVVSATQDNLDKTVVELLSPQDFRADIFPVGRLDKDTEGLLLLSNDGALAHELLSPKKHVEKEYFAKIDGEVNPEIVQKFAAGLTLSNGERVKAGELTSVKFDRNSQTSEIHLIIHEGKFHQVKRMFEAVGLRVTYLKRLRMGTLRLPDDLPLGHYRALTDQEISKLRQTNQ